MEREEDPCAALDAEEHGGSPILEQRHLVSSDTDLDLPARTHVHG